MLVDVVGQRASNLRYAITNGTRSRGLDKALEDEQAGLARAEKTLFELREQSGKRFEHEAPLKELIRHQGELNAALDLDKSERQVAPLAEGEASPENCEAKRAGRGADSRAPRWRRHRNDARHEWQDDDDYHDEDRHIVPQAVRPGMGTGP